MSAENATKLLVFGLAVVLAVTAIVVSAINGCYSVRLEEAKQGNTHYKCNSKNSPSPCGCR